MPSHLGEKPGKESLYVWVKQHEKIFQAIFSAGVQDATHTFVNGIVKRERLQGRARKGSRRQPKLRGNVTFMMGGDGHCSPNI